jgi:hypothetical protein
MASMRTTLYVDALHAEEINSLVNHPNLPPMTLRLLVFHRTRDSHLVYTSEVMSVQRCVLRHLLLPHSPMLVR